MKKKTKEKREEKREEKWRKKRRKMKKKRRKKRRNHTRPSHISSFCFTATSFRFTACTFFSLAVDNCSRSMALRSSGTVTFTPNAPSTIRRAVAAFVSGRCLDTPNVSSCAHDFAFFLTASDASDNGRNFTFPNGLFMDRALRAETALVQRQTAWVSSTQRTSIKSCVSIWISLVKSVVEKVAGKS